MKCSCYYFFIIHINIMSKLKNIFITSLYSYRSNNIKWTKLFRTITMFLFNYEQTIQICL